MPRKSFKSFLEQKPRRVINRKASLKRLAIAQEREQNSSKLVENKNRLMKTRIIFALAIVVAINAFAQQTPADMETALAQQTPHYSGIVRYPDGEPAAGVHVTLGSGGYYPHDDYNYSEAKTDTNGWYEILPPKKMHRSRNTFGPISVVAVRTSRILARDFNKNFAAVQEFPIGTTNVDLILKPAITFSGSVKNIEGESISGAEIYFGYVFGGSYIETIPSIKSNDQGQFTIPVLPQGVNYDLWEIMAKGYGSFGMDVPAKDTETNHYSFPPIVLKKVDRILTGQVVGPDGKPIPGITVEFGGQGQPMGTNGFLDHPTTKTDANGNFIFDDVCEGKVQITVNDWVDTASGHTLMSSPLGAESMFQAGDTNVVIRIRNRN